MRIENLQRLWCFLNKQRKKEVQFIFIFVISSTLAESITLAAVLPLMTVLIEPERIWSYEFIRFVASCFSISNSNDIVYPVIIAFAVVAIIAGIIRLITLWAIGRVSAAVGTDLASESYRRLVFEDYSYHISKNSSESISIIANQVTLVVNGSIQPILLFFSNLFICLALLGSLVVVDWRISLSLGGLLLLAYYLIVVVSRNKLLRNSNSHVQGHITQVRAIQEALGAIREIILGGHQSYYHKNFHDSDQLIRLAVSSSGFISAYPRVALETIVILAVLGLATALSLQPGGLVSSIPVLGALTLGALRLFPAFQNMYTGWASFHGNQVAFNCVVEMATRVIDCNEVDNIIPLQIKNEIILRDICFKYDDGDKQILKNLNLTIKKGERLGIISPSGEGKSTLLDIILGLIEPQSGSVIVDGQSIYGSNESKLRIAWWRNVAQVPQNIYLIDGSFEENIAFGVEQTKIDMQRVFQAAKYSQIAERIEQNSLSYAASVGERGVRLSGGERQRIGIARALYRQIGLLVLDEATSALDTETESKLMDTVYSLEKNLTVVIVAHRLTTLKRCDRVVKLEKGIITNEYVGKAIDDLILQSLDNNVENVLNGKCHE